MYLPLWSAEQTMQNVHIGVCFLWESVERGVQLLQCCLAQSSGSLEANHGGTVREGGKFVRKHYISSANSMK